MHVVIKYIDCSMCNGVLMCEPLSVYICHHSMVPTAQAGCMGGLILHAEWDLVGDDF